MARPELYVSTDIEADGACPGRNSMLSLASAVFDGHSEEPISTFSVNLELLHNATSDEGTRLFWKEHPKAYAATRTDLEDPVHGMTDYCEWLLRLGGKPIFVGYPAAFD